MADEIKISTGPVSKPVEVKKPDVPSTVGDGGELAKKLRQYNKEGKQGY